MKETKLIRLQKHDVPAAANMLAKAFMDYPLLVQFYPDERERQKIIVPWTAIALFVCIKYGEVYGTSPQLEGVAGWLPPGKAPFGLWQVLRSTPFRVLQEFSNHGGGRMSTAGDYFDAIHRRSVPFPHWYLQIIGVAPNEQGKGHSDKLIRPMLNRLDHEKMPCYLETQKKDNTQYYEKYGFHILNTELVPGTDLTTWGMLRI